MKQPLKGIVIVVIILVAVAAGAYWQLTYNKNTSPAGITNFEECVAAGNAIIKTLPAQCEADGRTFIENIVVIPPAGTSTSSIATSSGNIRVSAPVPYQEIGLPLIIRGEARTFESAYVWRIRDEDGSILVEGFGTANAPDIGQFGPFEATTGYPAPKGTRGTVQVFDYSAKDGSEIGTVSIPVVFKKDVAAMTVKVYFSNRIQDPNATHCEATYPVERRIAKTTGTAKAAIEELLRGPYSGENDKGFFTNVGYGTKLNGIRIDNGTAYADFSDALTLRDAGGSCVVTAIRSQIENTLKQFPTVKNVIISVDGRTEGVLEP